MILLTLEIIYLLYVDLSWAFQVLLVVKKPVNVEDTSLIPGLGRSPGGGHGIPLQCSCLENPMDRGVL